ncbi:MAG TPA: hypothetical protein VGH33_24045 [Isosphaeraceae bacterium]|jgi:hypothetical protein
MSIVKEAARVRGRKGRAVPAAPSSIREVSLIGRPPEGWADGDRVALAGHPYRVVGRSGHYAHLRIEPVSPTTG